jgi:hypothetical protein
MWTSDQLDWIALIIIIIIIISKNSPLFNVPMRNSELTHILGCCHAYFPLNFWLPRVVLQLSFECLEFLLDFNMRE